MERPRIAGVFWPNDVPFPYLLRTLASVFAQGPAQIALVMEEGVNAEEGDRSVDDAIRCFAEHPDLRFVFGREPSFFFATETGAFELTLICDGDPPASIRELIDTCLRAFPQGEGRVYARRPIAFGWSINSAKFRELTSPERMAREQRAEKELHAILERVRREDPGKHERLLGALGEAAWRANRTEDEEWQLAWLVEALEDEHLGR